MQLERISVDEANAINNSSPAFQNLRMGDRLKEIVDVLFELTAVELKTVNKNKKAKEEKEEE